MEYLTRAMGLPMGRPVKLLPPAGLSHVVRLNESSEQATARRLHEECVALMRAGRTYEACAKSRAASAIEARILWGIS